MKKFLSLTLNINNGEWSKTFFLFLLFFVIAFGSTLGLNASESLFIKNFSVGNIPYAFLGSATLSILFTIIMTYLFSKINIKIITIIINLVVFGLILGNFILMKFNIKISYI